MPRLCDDRDLIGHSLRCRMQALCEHGAAGHHIALDWRVEWAAGKVRTRVLAKARSSDLEEATATIASPARLLNACKAALATADSIALATPVPAPPCGGLPGLLIW